MSDWAVRPKPTGTRIVEAAGRFVVGQENPERRLARLPGELGAEARVDDRPRVDQVERCGRRKDLLPFEKERTLFREEKREPLVHLDLRAVRLDLGKIWVVGEIQREIRRPRHT